MKESDYRAYQNSNDVKENTDWFGKPVKQIDLSAEWFVNVRVQQSIPIIELARAAAAIGCVLEADQGGLKIVGREIKRRNRTTKVKFEEPGND